MNRTSTTWLTLATVSAIFALGTACSSGGDGGDGGSGGTKTTGGNSSAGTGGTNVNPASGSSSGGSSSAGSASGGSASGGSASGGAGGGSSTPSVCDGKTYALPVGEAYIDNFETDTRFTGWYSFSDTTPPNMPTPERVMMGALSTMYSGHVHATGIKSSKMMGYGAGFGFGLVDPAKGACVDLTAFAGISFWAKGTAGADNTLTFQVVSPATQPTDSMPAGDCKPMTACAFAHPKKVITLKPDWTQVVIKFADLAPQAAYSGKVLGFNMITDGPAYDVNIDEVTFYTDMAPTGPVMPATGTGGAGGSGGGGGTGGK